MRTAILIGCILIANGLCQSNMVDSKIEDGSEKFIGILLMAFIFMDIIDFLK